MIISLDTEKDFDKPMLLHDESPGDIKAIRDIHKHNKVNL